MGFYFLSKRKQPFNVYVFLLFVKISKPINILWMITFIAIVTSLLQPTEVDDAEDELLALLEAVESRDGKAASVDDVEEMLRRRVEADVEDEAAQAQRHQLEAEHRKVEEAAQELSKMGLEARIGDSFKALEERYGPLEDSDIADSDQGSEGGAAGVRQGLAGLNGTLGGEEGGEGGGNSTDGSAPPPVPDSPAALKDRLKSIVSSFLFQSEEGGDGGGEAAAAAGAKRRAKKATRLADGSIVRRREDNSWEVEDSDVLEGSMSAEVELAGVQVKGELAEAQSNQDPGFAKNLKKEAVGKLCLTAGGDHTALKKKCRQLGYATEHQLRYGSAGTLGLTSERARRQAEDIAVLNAQEAEADWVRASGEVQAAAAHSVERRQGGKEAAERRRRADLQQKAAQIEQRRAEQVLEADPSQYQHAADIKKAIAALDKIVSVQTDWTAFKPTQEDAEVADDSDSDSDRQRAEALKKAAQENPVLGALATFKAEEDSKEKKPRVSKKKKDFLELQQQMEDLHRDLHRPPPPPPPSPPPGDSDSDSDRNPEMDALAAGLLKARHNQDEFEGRARGPEAAKAAAEAAELERLGGAGSIEDIREVYRQYKMEQGMSREELRHQEMTMDADFRLRSSRMRKQAYQKEKERQARIKAEDQRLLEKYQLEAAVARRAADEEQLRLQRQDTLNRMNTTALDLLHANFAKSLDPDQPKSALQDFEARLGGA